MADVSRDTAPPSTTAEAACPPPVAGAIAPAWASRSLALVHALQAAPHPEAAMRLVHAVSTARRDAWALLGAYAPALTEPAVTELLARRAPLAHWADRADVAGTALDQVIIRWTLVTAFGPRPRPLYGFAVEVLLWLAARGRLQPAARQRLRAVLRWTARTQERRRRAAADILLACPSLDARTLRSLLDAFPDWRRLAARVAAHPSTPVTLLRRLVGARAASGRDAR